METELLTAREIARELKLNYRTVQRMLARGEIPGAFGLGNQWRVRRDDFSRWLEVQRSGKGEA